MMNKLVSPFGFELRQRRASFRAIAELRTQHCLPTSKTAIAAFCHQVLTEIVRARRRLGLSASEDAMPFRFLVVATVIFLVWPTFETMENQLG